MNYGYKILNTWACHLTLREKKKRYSGTEESFIFADADSSVVQGTEKNLTVPAEIAEGLFFLSGSTAGFVSTFHL